MQAHHTIQSRAVVFATGCGRSGTTAMRSALSAHPGVLSSNTENNMVGDLLLACDMNATIESRRVSMQMTEEEHNRRFAAFVLDLVFPGADHEDASRVPLLASYMTPQIAERAARVYPGSRFVCMLRDGVATIESRMAHSTFGQQSFQAQCEKWASWGSFYRWAMAREDCLIVRHEHLIADPDGCMTSVLGFLGLEPDSAPLGTLRTHRYHPTPDAQRPRWASWPDEDRRTFERICGECMRASGYEIPWEHAGETQAARCDERPPLK